VGPSRQHAQQQQDDEDQQYCAQAHFLLSQVVVNAATYAAVRAESVRWRTLISPGTGTPETGMCANVPTGKAGHTYC
jgi:hypothetical protein